MVETNTPELEVDEDGFTFDPNQYFEFTEEMRIEAEKIIA